LATKSGLTNSSVATFTYTITGGGAPTFGSAESAAISCNGGSPDVCANAAVTTTSGDIVIVIFGFRTNTSLQYCGAVTSVSSTIGGSPSGDTFTQVGIVPSIGTFGTCIVGYQSIGVHAGSGNYVVNINGVAASMPTGWLSSVMVVHPGSLTVLDGSICSNSTTGGATSAACSSALTPTGSAELFVGGVFAYDDNTGSPGTNSPFLAPSGYTANSGGVGSITVTYYIATSSPSAETPGFTGIGLGDGWSIMGWAVK